MPSADGRRLLLVTDNDRWALPHVRCEQAWIADAVASIQTQFLVCYGLDVVVLRALERTQSATACELELRSTESQAPAHTQWADPAGAAIEALPSDQREAIRAWREDRGTEQRLGLWQRPGWFGEARQWVIAAIRRAHLTDLGEVTQVKAAWNGSCVLRLETTGGAVYFKASPERRPGEPLVIRTLAADWARNLPTLLDADERRCWTLMYEAPGEDLDPEDTPGLASAARLMSNLQIDQAKSVQKWLEIGCPDRTLGKLERRLERLLIEIPNRLCTSGVLHAGERDSIASCVAPASELCRRLAQFSVPQATLHHEDFRAGNVRRTPHGDLVLVDWHETVVSHPFFTIQRFLSFVEPPNGASRHRIGESEVDHARCTVRDAYLEAFSAFDSRERLLKQFQYSSALAPVYDTFRFDETGDTDEALRREMDPEEAANVRLLMEGILDALSQYRSA